MWLVIVKEVYGSPYLILALLAIRILCHDGQPTENGLAISMMLCYTTTDGTFSHDDKWT